MREQLSIFLGVFRYEFKMQIRRKPLWIAFAGFILLLLSNAFTTLHSSERSIATLPLVQFVAAVTLQLNWLPAIGIGVFLADRFPRDRSSKVDELLEVVSLTSAANRKLKTYSGGMKRRIGIAQALLNDPRLLIVDEPTAGLDPEERIRFRNLLSELGGDRTVLLSTHIVEDIAQTCRNLAILKQGRVVFQGTTMDLVGEARGRVWIVTTSGAKPQGDFTIVSTLHMGTSVQYRLVGSLAAPDEDGAVATEPSLEDSYVWLMREQRTPGVTMASK